MKRAIFLATILFQAAATTQAAPASGTISLETVKAVSAQKTGQLVAPWLPEATGPTR